MVYNGMMYGGGMGGWGISMFLFWALVLVGLFFLIRWLAQQSTGNTYKDQPLSIAKERYARGEIAKKEFEEIKKVIGGDS